MAPHDKARPHPIAACRVIECRVLTFLNRPGDPAGCPQCGRAGVALRPGGLAALDRALDLAVQERRDRGA